MRKHLLFLIDAGITALSCGVAYLIVQHTTDIRLATVETLISTIVFILSVMAGLCVVGTYRKVWRYANLRDIFEAMAGVVLGALTCLALLFIIPGLWFSTLYCAMEFLVSACSIVGSRLLYLYLNDFAAHDKRVPQENTMIIGGGQACQMLIREMLRTQGCQYRPVCIVDDDPDKISRSIQGVPVCGPMDRVGELVRLYQVKTILFAIPSCPVERRKQILADCFETGCKVRTLPNVHKMMLNQSLLQQTTRIPFEDLLGRSPVVFNDANVAAFIKDKVCLVTGGGGSIGSELCRQVAHYHPKQIIILDIYENNAYDIQQELLDGPIPLDLDVEIASVRDAEKLEQVFRRFRPDIVFHAAAHKHVPLMEHNPEEAVKNNIFGTFNTARLADRYGVRKFVLVSTDKAVNPTNVMGATKRCCEMVVQYFYELGSGTEFVAVRFGNVLGSNGSVIPLFRRQIENGGPVKVTHPDINRFFMTIPEAVSLILQAASMADGGEIFVLDMGEPVKIVTLAENLIRMYGEVPYETIKIEFTGLRPGEKLYEELLMNEEGLTATERDKIYIGNQIYIDTDDFARKLEQLREVVYRPESTQDDIVAMLRTIVPTFCPRTEQEQEQAHELENKQISQSKE